MANNYSARAQKAAATRAENLEKERREGERLAQETERGRTAKHRALANAVWIDDKKRDLGRDDTPDHRESIQEMSGTKKKKKRTKTNESKTKKSKTSDDSDQRYRPQQPRRPPPAANFAESDNEPQPVVSKHQVLKINGTSTHLKHHDPTRVATRDTAETDEETPPKPNETSNNHAQATKAQKTGQKRSTKSLQDDSDDSEDTSSDSETNSDSSDSSSDSAEDSDMNDFAAEHLVFVSKDRSSKSRAAANTTLAQDLFTINNEDVEMVTHSRPSSRPVSLPPMSEIADASSGYDDSMMLDLDDNDGYQPSQGSKAHKHAHSPEAAGLSDDIEDFFEKSSRPRNPSKRSKAKHRRAEAFLSERPAIKASSTVMQSVSTKQKKKKQDRKVPNDTNSKSKSNTPAWLVSSPLVRIEGSKKINLKPQARIIQDILHHAIAKASEDVIFQKTWPEEDSRTVYGRGLLINACNDEDLAALHKNTLLEVKQLLKTDLEFTKALSDLVVARLSLTRSPAKCEASKFVPFYQLGLGDSCKERVKSLLENFSFHFTGSWGGDNGHSWQPNRKEAFLNPVIINTIRAGYFANAKAIGYRYVSQFSSSIPAKPNEKELPAALLALAITGVYSCLYEFRSGNQEELDFEGNLFMKANKDVLDLLKKLQDNKPIDFHNRMHHLYRLTVNTSDDGEATFSSAYDIIDF